MLQWNTFAVHSSKLFTSKLKDVLLMLKVTLPSAHTVTMKGLFNNAAFSHICQSGQTGTLRFFLMLLADCARTSLLT
jgi:hypothetical protein